MIRVLLVCFMMLDSIVYATQYNDPCFGIFFTLPDSWEYTNASDLSEEKFLKLARAFDNISVVCHKKGVEPFSIPGILVQCKKFKEATSGQAEKELSSGYKPHIGTEYLAGWMMWRMRTTSEELAETGSKDYYDSDRHFAYGMKGYEHKDGRKLCVIDVKLLGNNKMTELNCYWSDGDSSNFLKMIDDVIASFKYSEGDKFKLTSREVSYETGKKTISLISKLTTWLLIVLIALWILKKIFNR